MQLIGTHDPLAALLMVYLLTAVLTELMGHNPSVVLMVGIAVTVAHAAQCDPRPFVIAVAFAAATSFATPVGYPTNTMVYYAGGYRFTDFMQRAQARGDVFGLPQRERALAGGDAQGLRHRFLINLRSAGRLRRLTSSVAPTPSRFANRRPSGVRERPVSFARATRQLRWMRTKRFSNSSSSAFSGSSISTSPRA